jgi:hypothetical protein
MIHKVAALGLAVMAGLGAALEVRRRGRRSRAALVARATALHDYARAALYDYARGGQLPPRAEPSADATFHTAPDAGVRYPTFVRSPDLDEDDGRRWHCVGCAQRLPRDGDGLLRCPRDDCGWVGSPDDAVLVEPF